MEENLQKIIPYLKTHWPSKLKREWQATPAEYAEISKKIFAELSEGKTKGRELVRLAGLSGSGKTSQLLPAAKAYFESRDKFPVEIAARVFAPFHPHFQEIIDFYGEEKIREMTDKFSAVMLFLVLSELMKNGYDIILDVSFLSSDLEKILLGMLEKGNYELLLLMVVVSLEVAEKHLKNRSWRHELETEREFARTTKKSLTFYIKNRPKTRAILWNTYEKSPIFDDYLGESALEIYQKYAHEMKIPIHDPESLREGKIRYLSKDK